MATVFFNKVDIESGFTTEDIEYLRKQILTRRSVLSDMRNNTMQISYLFEAAKTMLTAAEFVSRIHDVEITSISIFVDSGSTTEFTDEYPKAIVIANGHFKPHAFDFIEHENAPPRYKFSSVHTFVGRTENSSPMFVHKVSDEVHGDVFTNTRVANTNGVLAYCENFPAPSLYQQSFVDNCIMQMLTNSDKDPFSF